MVKWLLAAAVIVFTALRAHAHTDTGNAAAGTVRDVDRVITGAGGSFEERGHPLNGGGRAPARGGATAGSALEHLIGSVLEVATFWLPVGSCRERTGGQRHQ